MNGKISVIIPCYNVEERVGSCLDSVLSSSIGREHLEIILVDDASTDGTVEILRRYEEAYPEHIMLILCEENGRQGAARNIGLTYASGDYISFVDSDDYIRTDMYEILSALIEQTSADIIQFRFNIVTANDKEPDQLPELQAVMYDLAPDENRRNALLQDGIMNDSCTSKFYRCCVLEKAIKYGFGQYAEGVCYEEPLFTFPLRFFADKVLNINLPLYYYYLNPEGTMNNTMKAASSLKDHENVQLLLYDKLRNCDKIYSKYKYEIDLKFLHSFIYEKLEFAKGRGFSVMEADKAAIKKTVSELLPDAASNPYLQMLPDDERELILEFV